jgi:simple sugar transport system ATP-binding protein
MRIALGLVQPDSGEILVQDQPAEIHDPLMAARLGIAMVHQHFSVIEALTVWENVHLGERDRLDPRAIRAEVAEIAQQYGLDVDVDARVRDLTAGQRQRVEIVKCLRRNPSLMILDEPTSVLTLAESEALFDVLRRVVQDEGRAAILISHKLDEILHATDRIVIMRDGAVVMSVPTEEANAPLLAQGMVGREVSLRSEASALGALDTVVHSRHEHADPEFAHRPVALRIDGAVARGQDGRQLLDGLDLQVREGEILGVIGVEGNGQKDLGDLLSSLLPLESGAVEVTGQTVPSGRAGAMSQAGVGVIPEDRHDSGCVLDLSVAENIALGNPELVSSHGRLDPVKMRALAQQLIDEYEISVPSPTTTFRRLSGGNQQRVVLARELAQGPKVLVAAQPTRGLDVGAIEYMTEQLRAAASAGVAVLLVSTELEEVLELADRVAVIHRGRIVGEMDRDEFDLGRLGLMLGGQAA